MHRVELIPKTSTLDDIIESWVNSGREDNRKEGVFVFDEVESAHVENGVLRVFAGNKIYFYNMADFYRVKILDVTQPELF